MRCSARRRRAAATISIARVILRMFWTDAIRFLTSRWRHGLRGRAGRFLLGLGLLAAVARLAVAGRGLRLDALAVVALGSGWPSSSRS